jgi:uncharacterized protein (UPF0335 family)
MVDVTNEQLERFVERIERVEEELDGLKSDRKDIYTEVKSYGYDTKILRQIIRLRKKDSATRREEEDLLNTYKCALGLDD